MGVLFVLNSTGGEVSRDLSDRSKKYLEKKSQETGSEWSNLNLNDSSTRSNITYKVEGCYSFVVPFSVFNERSQDECSNYYAIDSPKGNVVIYIKDASNIESVDGAEGVSFRRLDPEKYEEKLKTINGKEFLVFKNLDEPYESIAYHYFDPYYLAVVLKAASVEPLDDKFEEILKSVDILK